MQAANQERTYLPEGFPTITPYLIVKNATELLTFLTQAFGAEEKLSFPTPDGKIMHAQADIADSPVEFAEGNDQYPPRAGALHVYLPDADAAYRRAIEASATSLFEPTDRDYGDREAGVRDSNGNQWYIATHKLRPGRHMPDGFRPVTPYLIVSGAAGLIDFLEKVFEAKQAERHANADGSIAHAAVRIGDSMVEMSDAHGQWQPMSAAIHVYVPDADAVYAKALDAGGTSVHPVKDQFYGERSGGVRDPFGNEWYIATFTGRSHST
jgi:PhnB protein